jgi:hypothetical protein
VPCSTDAFAPIQDTLEVNGDNADPLYKYLKQQQPRAVPGSRYALNAEIGWNYEKVELALMASRSARCWVCSAKAFVNWHVYHAVSDWLRRHTSEAVQLAFQSCGRGK